MLVLQSARLSLLLPVYFKICSSARSYYTTMNKKILFSAAGTAAILLAVASTGVYATECSPVYGGGVVCPTNTPTLTPTPTAPACNATCTDNNQCPSGRICYKNNSGDTYGYCRNPLCTWSTDCNCGISVTPTPVITVPTNLPKAGAEIFMIPGLASVAGVGAYLLNKSKSMGRSR